MYIDCHASITQQLPHQLKGGERKSIAHRDVPLKSYYASALLDFFVRVILMN